MSLESIKKPTVTQFTDENGVNKVILTINAEEIITTKEEFDQLVVEYQNQA